MSLEVNQKNINSSSIKISDIKENYIEIPLVNNDTNTGKALVKKGEQSLKNRNVNMIKPALNKTIGILFYVASFIISAAISSIFIFTIVEV